MGSGGGATGQERLFTWLRQKLREQLEFSKNKKTNSRPGATDSRKSESGNSAIYVRIPCFTPSEHLENISRPARAHILDVWTSLASHAEQTNWTRYSPSTSRKIKSRCSSENVNAKIVDFYYIKNTIFVILLLNFTIARITADFRG